MRRLLLLMSIALSGLIAAPASCTVWTVRNLRDSGAGSLRAALDTARPGDTVVIRLRGTLTLRTELVLSKNVTVRSDVGSAGQISGGNTTRIFHVLPGVTAAFQGLNLLNGRPAAQYGGAVLNEGSLTVTSAALFQNTADQGGAIYNRGTLALTDTGLWGNQAEGGAIYSTGSLTITRGTLFDNLGDSDGGAIYSTGTLSLTRSFVALNEANVGAGIINEGEMLMADSAVADNDAAVAGGIDNQGRLTIDRCTLADNTAEGAGALQNYGELRLYNSTVSQNHADFAGGIHNFGRAVLLNSTVADNSAPSNGGGLDNHSELTLGNTIVARNTSESIGPDIHGAVTSLGHNLISDTRDASGFVATDLLNLDPRLGPVQSNGGPTATQPLLAGSPAIDAGDNTLLSGLPGTFDQRGSGYPRVASGGRAFPAAVDIGAVEHQGADLSVTLVAAGRARAGTLVTYTFTIRNLGPELAEQVVLTDRLPDGTVLVSAQSDAGTLTGPPAGGRGTLRANIPALPSGRSIRIVLTVRMLATVDTLNNDVNVSAASFDPNGLNNDATVTVKR